MYKNFSNYEIFADGRIWSKVRKKWLKPQKNEQRGGYQQVGLTDNNGKRHMEYVHRVCWMAVNGVWEIPDGMELNHLDEDKTNNHISNLQLCTHKENVNHGTRNERSAKALTNHPDKSKRVGAFKNNELMMVFDSTREAQRNGFKQSAVSACCRNCFNREGNNKYKGFIWKYLDEQ